MQLNFVNVGELILLFLNECENLCRRNSVRSLFVRRHIYIYEKSNVNDELGKLNYNLSHDLFDL